MIFGVEMKHLIAKLRLILKLHFTLLGQAANVKENFRKLLFVLQNLNHLKQTKHFSELLINCYNSMEQSYHFVLEAILLSALVMLRTFISASNMDHNFLLIWFISVQ